MDGRFLVNFLIGEPAYRYKGVIAEIALPFREYFFETLGLKMAMASVPSRNSPMVRYLLKNGWTMERTVRGGAKSNTDGGVLDICLFCARLGTLGASGREGNSLRRKSAPKA